MWARQSRESRSGGQKRTHHDAGHRGEGCVRAAGIPTASTGHYQGTSRLTFLYAPPRPFMSPHHPNCLSVSPRNTLCSLPWGRIAGRLRVHRSGQFKLRISGRVLDVPSRYKRHKRSRPAVITSAADIYREGMAQSVQHVRVWGPHYVCMTWLPFRLTSEQEGWWSPVCLLEPACSARGVRLSSLGKLSLVCVCVCVCGGCVCMSLCGVTCFSRSFKCKWVCVIMFVFERDDCMNVSHVKFPQPSLVSVQHTRLPVLYTGTTCTYANIHANNHRNWSCILKSSYHLRLFRDVLFCWLMLPVAVGTEGMIW